MEIIHWIADLNSLPNIIKIIIVNTGLTILMSLSLKIRPIGSKRSLIQLKICAKN